VFIELVGGSARLMIEGIPWETEEYETRRRKLNETSQMNIMEQGEEGVTEDRWSGRRFCIEDSHDVNLDVRSN
jgi:hypothetical protein